MAKAKSRSSGGNRNAGSSRRKSSGGDGRKWLVGLILISAIVAGGWYFGSPYWTLYQMKQAVENGDSATLAGYIDEDALRENLRKQMKERLASVVNEEKGLAALGAILSHAPVGPLADRIVEPEGLRDLMKGLSVGGMPRISALRTTQPDVIHDGVSGFRVHNPKEPAGEGDAIFRRYGIGWKLVGVELPPIDGDGKRDAE